MEFSSLSSLGMFIYQEKLLHPTPAARLCWPYLLQRACTILPWLQPSCWCPVALLVWVTWVFFCPDPPGSESSENEQILENWPTHSPTFSDSTYTCEVFHWHPHWGNKKNQQKNPNIWSGEVSIKSEERECVISSLWEHPLLNAEECVLTVETWTEITSMHFPAENFYRWGVYFSYYFWRY